MSKTFVPPTLEYLGLLPAIRELVNQVKEQSGIEVNFKVKGPQRNFEPEEGILIYRIAQEALRNIWKDSQASKAEIEVDFNSDQTVIKISDNGKGFRVEESSELLKAGKLGLMGMKERANLLRGHLTINSKLDEGTTVILTIPTL